MSPIIFWMLGVAFAAAAMVMTTALELHLVQFALATVIVAFISISGIRDHQAKAVETSHPAALAAVISRHMGMLWAWAAISIALVYGLMLSWTNWFPSFLVLVMGAALCLFMANILSRDADTGDADSRVVSLVSVMAKAQFAATCIAVGGLLAFGKFSASAFGGETKWAGVNILLCTAIGLAGLSGYSVAQDPASRHADASDETAAPPAAASRRQRRMQSA